jgi:MFS family permease
MASVADRAHDVVRRHGTAAILFTMCIGTFIAQLDSQVVNLAIKHIGSDLDAGISQLQWVMDSYNLCYATLLLTGGTLGDLYGRVRVFIIGIALIVAGSIVCAAAPNGAVLIAGRALTGLVLIEVALLVIGIGLGLNTGPVNAVAVASLPPARAGTASGLANTARMVGATLGIAVLGALFAVHAGGDSPDAMISGLRLAYLGGAMVELAGALIALAFIRADSMEQAPG